MSDGSQYRALYETTRVQAATALCRRADLQFHGSRSATLLAGDLEAWQHVSEPGLRIDVVHLAGFDQGIDGRGTMAASVRTGESPVSSSDRHPPQRSFGGVVRKTDAAVVEEADLLSKIRADGCSGGRRRCRRGIRRGQIGIIRPTPPQPPPPQPFNKQSTS
jgi:hypothetical protein